MDLPIRKDKISLYKLFFNGDIGEKADGEGAVGVPPAGRWGISRL